MNITLAIMRDTRLRESLRAALPETDLVLFENSVDDALRRLVSMRADVVVLDDAGNQGLSALSALREGLPAVTESGAPPRVVVLTTRADDQTRAAFLASGATHCLGKPFEVDALRSAIDGADDSTATPTETLATKSTEESADANALHQHRMALRWMSRNTAYLENHSKLCRSLVDAVVDIFDVTRAAVLLECENAFKVAAAHGLEEAMIRDIRLSPVSGMMRRFAVQSGVLDAARDHGDSDALKELAVFGGLLALPLLAGGRPCGALIIGPKYDGAPYSFHERELVSVMARSASACLEKSRRHQDLARQQQRVDAVLSNLDAGVVTVDLDGRITMMNESAERILRLDAAELLGRRVQKLGSAFADVVLRAMRSKTALARQEIHDTAIRGILGLSVTPLGGEGAVALFTLLPEPKNETHSPSNHDALTNDGMWENLSTRVAQEIKNPMVAISTFAQLLPSRYDSAEFRDEFSSVVQDEVNRINGVVELLYSFARKPRLSLQDSDLNATVRQVLQGLGETLTDAGVEVKYALEDGPLEVRQDPLLLAQAIHNLVNNAIDAMDGGGTLTLQTERENGSCALFVRDSGPGITDEDAARVFEPFYSTKETGMGLGLTMAHRIVQLHGGDLTYVRDESGGAFRLHLPAALTPSPTVTT